ncbi:MAG: hypothetical protein AABZ28_02355 [Nitrospinota bacterium]|jgi:hypothetical protein
MNILERWLENPEKFRLLRNTFYLLIAVIVLFDISLHLFTEHHPHFFGDKIWGFWSFFGLTFCVLMIIVCKGAAHKFLMKKEDYYD